MTEDAGKKVTDSAAWNEFYMQQRRIDALPISEQERDELRAQAQDRLAEKIQQARDKAANAEYAAKLEAKDAADRVKKEKIRDHIRNLIFLTVGLYGIAILAIFLFDF